MGFQTELISKSLEKLSSQVSGSVGLEWLPGVFLQSDSRLVSSGHHPALEATV